MDKKHIALRLMAGAGAALLLGVFCMSASAGTRTQHQNNKALAHQIAQAVRAQGHGEDNPIIRAAQEWWQEQDAMERESPAYTTEAQRQEHPVAAQVWQRLREAGIPEPAAAGILGNMMSECGGQTLELNPSATVGGYYGLCMWYILYTPQIEGQDVDGQLDVLLETMPGNMAAFGGDYDKFLEQTDAGTAAWYFCRHYERAPWHTVRAENAEKALGYFGGEG